MKRINLRKALEGKATAVKFKNIRQCKEFLQICDSQGITWCDDTKATAFNFMEKGSRDCIDLEEGYLSFCTESMYKKLNLKVIEYEKFLEEHLEEITIK